MNITYFNKLKWSEPETIQTAKGPRIKRWVEASLFDRLMWDKHRSLLQSWSMTFKEDGGRCYFFHWTIPAEQQQLEQQQTKVLATARESDFPVPCPPGLSFYPFQRAAVEFCITKKASLIGDEMGLGKTQEVIGLINALNSSSKKPHRILLVCPAYLKSQWKAELVKWLTRRYSIGVAEDGVFPSSDIVIISYQSLVRYKDKLSFYWCMVIADECHLVSNRTTQMTRILCGHRPTKKEKGKGLDITVGIQAKLKVAMTGTPVRDRPRDFFPILNWLRPDLFPNWWEYVNTYCGGKQPDGSWRSDLASNQQEMQQILRSNLMIRRLTNDVFDDFPEKRRTTTIIPITNACASKISGLAKAANIQSWMTQLSIAKTALELSKCGSAGEYYRATQNMQQVVDKGASSSFELMHQIGLAKVPAAIDIIRSAVEQTPKILIFCHHQDIVQLFKKEFTNAVMVTGAQSDTERFENVRRFQENPEVGPLIGTIKCAVGYTATAATTAYVVERTWLPGDINQAEKRLHRIGQKQAVMIIHLVLESSIDVLQAEALVQKQNQIDSILDQDHRTKEEAEPVVPGVGVTVSRAHILNNQLTDPTEIQFLYDQAEKLRIGRMLVADQIIIQRIMERPQDGRHALLLRELVRTYHQPSS